MHFVLTGPESSGKSTLAEALATQFETPWVPECARSYLTSATYEATDLLRIADAQQAAEVEFRGAFFFSDTDLQTIYIWWQERFGPVPASLAQAYLRQTTRHYLLCEPDLAWQEDPLRENPHDRKRLFTIYQKDLDQRGLSYDLVSGEGNERANIAANAVKRALATYSSP